MPNKHKLRNREDWISIVITIAFVLGFLALANSGTMSTGFVAMGPTTVIESTQIFEVNSAIPITAILEITSGTQKAEMPLSELTIKLSEMQNIQPMFEDGALVAYNISNMTVDLASFNIEPTESVTIRFIEVYKEVTRELVTKRITKEETITEEIISITENITQNITEENITEFTIQPTENITKKEFETQQIYNVKTYYLIGGSVTGTYTGALEDTEGVAQAIWASTAEDEDSIFILNTAYSENTNVSGSINATFRCDSDSSGGGASGMIINVAFYNCDDDACASKEEICADGTDINCLGSPGTYTRNCDGADYTIPQGNYLAVEFDGRGKGGNTYVYFNTTAPDNAHVIVTEAIKAAADTADPFVNINFPLNRTNSTAKFINFTFNATDTDSGIESCDLWLNKQDSWELNYTDSSITETINQTINITLEDGGFLWRIECNDSALNPDNRKNSTTYNLTIDTTGPIVNLNFPLNRTNSSAKYTNFTFNATDTLFSIDSCVLWLNKQGTWEYNFTDATITELINQSINITLEDTSLLWKIECNDTLNNRANSTTFNLTVDTTIPMINLNFPLNRTNSSASYINFTYNVTNGLLGIDSCVLWLNKQDSWEYNYTDPSVAELVNQTINITLEDGGVLWRIECNDTLNNRANSTTFNLTVDSTAPIKPIVIPKVIKEKVRKIAEAVVEKPSSIEMVFYAIIPILIISLTALSFLYFLIKTFKKYKKLTVTSILLIIGTIISLIPFTNEVLYWAIFPLAIIILLTFTIFMLISNYRHIIIKNFENTFNLKKILKTFSIKTYVMLIAFVAVLLLFVRSGFITGNVILVTDKVQLNLFSVLITLIIITATILGIKKLKK